MVPDEEHFDPGESILKDSLNTIKSAWDQRNVKNFSHIELKGKLVNIPVLGYQAGGNSGLVFWDKILR